MLDDLVYTCDPYSSRPWKAVLREMAEDGVKIVSVLYPLPVAWRPDGTFDFTELDKVTDAIAAISPEFRMLPRVFLETPDWWDEQHPEELVQYLGQSPKISAKPRHAEPVWRYEAKIYHSTQNPSVASELWRRDAGNALTATVKHLLGRYKREQIEGIHIAYGNCGEWFDFGSFHGGFYGCTDFSGPMLRAYRKYLCGKYGNKPEFEKAMPPDKRERVSSEYGMLRSPAFARKTLDYFDCASREKAAAIAHFCRCVKAVDNTLVTGIFRVDSAAIGSSVYLMHSLDHTWKYAVEIPELDFISTPNDYYDSRKNGMFSQSMVRTISKRKIFIAENDVNTGTPREQNSEKDFWAYMEHSGFDFAMGSGRYWLYDFGLGWYRSDRIRLATNILAKAYPELIGLRKPAEVAVVLDQDSQACCEGGAGMFRQFLKFVHKELPHAGVPFDVIGMEDFFTDTPRKLYIFRDKVLASAAEAAKIREFLKKNKASAVWFGPAGCVTPDKVDFAASEALTGFRIMPVENAAASNSVTLTEVEDPLLQNIVLPYACSCVEDGDGLFPPVLTAENGKVLGEVESVGLPGVRILREDGRFDFWSASPLIPAALIRNLMIESGAVPRLLSGTAAIYGADKVLAVKSDLHQTLEFAGPGCYDLITSRRYPAANGKFRVPFAAGEAKILILEE